MALLKCWTFLSSSQGPNGPRAEASGGIGLCAPMTPSGLRPERTHLQGGRPGVDPWGEKISWRRARQPTLVFLPGESPQTEEPGGLLPMGSQRVAYD